MASAIQAAAPPSPCNPTAVALRLLMLNTLHSSPEQARHQADWIAAQEGAGIVVITEVSSGPTSTGPSPPRA
jgi:hypothetical protein